MSCWKHAVLHVKTGGGKTYTMDGDRSASDSLANSAGVIPRTVELIFQEERCVFCIAAEGAEIWLNELALIKVLSTIPYSIPCIWYIHLHSVDIWYSKCIRKWYQFLMDFCHGKNREKTYKQNITFDPIFESLHMEISRSRSYATKVGTSKLPAPCWRWEGSDQSHVTLVDSPGVFGGQKMLKQTSKLSGFVSIS